MRKILLFLLLIYFTFAITTVSLAHDDDIPKILSEEETIFQD